MRKFAAAMAVLAISLVGAPTAMVGAETSITVQGPPSFQGYGPAFPGAPPCPEKALQERFVISGASADQVLSGQIVASFVPSSTPFATVPIVGNGTYYVTIPPSSQWVPFDPSNGNAEIHIDVQGEIQNAVTKGFTGSFGSSAGIDIAGVCARTPTPTPPVASPTPRPTNTVMPTPTPPVPTLTPAPTATLVPTPFPTPTATSQVVPTPATATPAPTSTPVATTAPTSAPTSPPTSGVVVQTSSPGGSGFSNVCVYSFEGEGVRVDLHALRNANDWIAAHSGRADLPNDFVPASGQMCGVTLVMPTRVPTSTHVPTPVPTSTPVPTATATATATAAATAAATATLAPTDAPATEAPTLAPTATPTFRPGKPPVQLP